MMLYPGLVNSTFYAPTKELNGIVALASKELQDAINDVQLGPGYQMTEDLNYLATCSEAKIPSMPWARNSKHFPRLSMKCDGDDDAICFEILKEADYKTIFPRLPVYNRPERTRVQRKRRHWGDSS